MINVGDKGQYDDEYAANEGENGGKGSGKKLGKRKKTAGGADRADAKFSGAKKTKAGASAVGEA